MSLPLTPAGRTATRTRDLFVHALTLCWAIAAAATPDFLPVPRRRPPDAPAYIIRRSSKVCPTAVRLAFRRGARAPALWRNVRRRPDTFQHPTPSPDSHVTVEECLGLLQNRRAQITRRRRGR